MGRKVHPVGFRLKYIRDWNTRWYAEKQQYQDLLHEDFAIRAMIRKEMPQAGISALNIERAAPNQVQVTIHTAKPGIVIGRKGASVKELRGKLRQLTDKAVKLEVEEISQPDTDAQLIAENVANQMERRISHSRAMKRAVQQAMRQGAEGVRIEVGAVWAVRKWRGKRRFGTAVSRVTPSVQTWIMGLLKR